MAAKIGQMLLDRGVISRQDLERAQIVQRDGDAEKDIAPGEKLGRVVIRLGIAQPMEVVRALCEQRGIDDFLLVSSYVVSPALVAKVPLEVAKHYSALPLVRLEDSTEALFATDRRQPPEAAAEVARLLGFRVDWVEVKDPQFARTIDRVYEKMAERGVFSVRVGEVLVREGLVTQDEVDWALKIARRSNTRIGRVLMDEGLVTEDDFHRVLARLKRMPLARAEDILSDPSAAEVASGLSRTFAVFNEIVPFRLEGSRLSVACGDPDADVASLKKIYNCRDVVAHLVTLSDLVTLLREFYGLEEEEARRKGYDLSGERDEDAEELADLLPDSEGEADSAADTRGNMRRRYEILVARLLAEAIRRRASDIHVENYETNVIVRLRIDGLLYDARTLRIDKTNVGGIVNVIKIMCDMNIAEHRLPQGGRFRKRTAAGETFDFRVQVQPTLYGENVVIRLLNQTASIVPLEDLGFAPARLERYVRATQNPSGLILITGPTGSGKTTTLYSTLDLLRRDTTTKIVTIEDPIEYSLPRIQQSQTHETIGYTFAAATRSFLRLDPDIALVGETRDEETARETIKLSQTGHLVFSTLHTNTSVSAAGRMSVLGVDAELLAGELLVVIAQRLAAKICPHCKTTYEPEESVLREFYPNGVPSGVRFFKGEGCPRCEGLGHKGRIALAEFWFVDYDSRVLICKRASEDEIVEKTLGKSFFPLVMDALEKIQEGLVDITALTTVIPMASIAAAARLVQDKGLVPQHRIAAG